MKLRVIIDDRDHAVIMAALRHAQNDPHALDEYLRNADWGAPGSALEIDDLCERFNCEAEIL